MTYRHPRALARYVCWVTVLAAQTLAVRATDDVLRLEQAAELAARAAPALTALRERERAASEELVRAGALPDPELVLGIDNLTATGRDAFAVGADDMTMRRIGVRQMLPAGAKRAAARVQARADAAMRAAEHEVGNLQVRRAAASAWVLRWAAERESALLQALSQDTQVAVAATTARVAASGSAGDALNVRALALEIENRISDNQARQTAAQATLLRWLGARAEQPLGEPPDFAMLPLPEARALAMLDRSSELRVFDAHERLADAAVALARAERRPDFSVMAGYGQRAGGRDDMISLEVGIGLPLFASRRQDRGLAARMAEHDALAAEHEDARRDAEAAIRADYAQWRGLAEQVRRDREQRLPLLRDRSAVALAGYRSGSALEPWIAARRDEIAAAIEIAAREQALGIAWVDLAYRFVPESQP